MATLKELIVCEIGDFFAVLGQMGEPETPEEMQRQLMARVMPLLTNGSTHEKRPIIEDSATVDWGELAQRGLVFRINYEVLLPQGLAMMYDPASGISDGALVASDGIWNYSDEIIKSAKQKGWL